MNGRSGKSIPESILELQQQLDQLRGTQPRRSRLPDELWQAAVELARQHGIYQVAHALRLDYMGLKKRLGGTVNRRRKVTKPAFVELMPARQESAPECVIELESMSGAKMRIQWKAALPLDWASLLRAWRDTTR